MANTLHPTETDFENGTRVRALAADGKMHSGIVTTHTCDMRGRTDGLIVRFDDGSFEEYDYSATYLIQPIAD